MFMILAVYYLGIPQNVVYVPIIGLLGECHLYFHQNGHSHITLLVAHEHNTQNAFYESRH